MPSQDLINAIGFRLEQGESREQIKEILIAEGWREDAIDEVFIRLPKSPSFWQSLPIYPYFKALDDKTANLPPKVILTVSILLIISVVIVGLLVYFSIDPKVFNGEPRDQEREVIYSQLKTALNNYNVQNNRYPDSLSELVPSYIKYEPMDPKTKKPYGYMAVNGGQTYNLCIYFETRSPTEGCIHSDVIDFQLEQTTVTP